MIDADQDQAAPGQNDQRPACPQFQPVSPAWGYPVDGYCMQAGPRGRLMIPSVEESLKYCATGRSALCPWHSSGPPGQELVCTGGRITVGDDMAISGSVTTTGVAGTAAHIHLAAAGQNGPVAVPLMKSGDNGWAVPAGTKLTDAQYAAFKAGNLLEPTAMYAFLNSDGKVYQRGMNSGWSFCGQHDVA
jgi:CHRD domain